MLIKRYALLFILSGFGFAIPGSAAPPETGAPHQETIVLMRHGEKPAEEIGQINIQGLNRALALPDVLVAKFKKADFIFAPGTSDKMEKGSVMCSYLRPLETIAPTAIRLGLPVNTDFGFKHTDDLETELLKEKYQDAVIYVAWEHHALDAMVKKMLQEMGGPSGTVPDWPGDDFDSIFVVTIRTDASHKRSAEFRVEHESLKPGMAYPSPGKE